MGLRVPVQKAVPLIKASQTIELTPSTFRCSAEKPQLPLNIAKTAFIGSNIGPAGEYHDSDFSFEVRDSKQPACQASLEHIKHHVRRH